MLFSYITLWQKLLSTVILILTNQECSQCKAMYMQTLKLRILVVSTYQKYITVEKQGIYSSRHNRNNKKSEIH